MHESRPSRTALRVALRRAAHQLYDPPPLVLEDPVAVAILGKEYAEELHKTANKLHKPFSVGLRAFLVARSRYAEDNLAKAIERSHNPVTQYVLLGAGLDTFAYRNPHPSLRIFEVDHPATQQWKHDLLETNSIPIPASLTFAPVDFERESLPEQLAAAGFNPCRPHPLRLARRCPIPDPPGLPRHPWLHRHLCPRQRSRLRLRPAPPRASLPREARPRFPVIPGRPRRRTLPALLHPR